MKKDNFGNRMKEYERASQTKLTKRMPVIIRLDGKAFHTYTKGLKRPFDANLMVAMTETAKFLCENIMGCKMAYAQSDEISLLITNDDKLTTESWYDNNLQKIVSVSSSLATAFFNNNDWYGKPEALAFFDSRAFTIPKDEVANYFLWRQKDATKNSISMVAQSEFKQSELNGLNGKQLQDKLFLEKNINWNNCPTWQKRGVCVVKKYEIHEKLPEVFMEFEKTRLKWTIDYDIPIFSKDREYIEKYLRREF